MLKLIRTTNENIDFKNLIKELDADLYSRYDIRQAEYDQYNIIEKNNTVIIAYLNDQAVGCGCFKPFDDHSIEIKRMYVTPATRGKGIAYTILNELETWAKEHNFSRAVLETGTNQPEAVKLYNKSGYNQIENFEPYIGMEDSICMSKNLN